jgi:internalin A
MRQLTDEDLLRVERVKSVELQSNSIATLPNDMLSCGAHLESLSCTWNQLTSLPRSLAQLIHLQSLDVSFNRLTCLPLAVLDLSSLKVVRIFYPCAW